jgi:transaldolase
MGFTAAQQSASGGDAMIQNPSLAALSAAGVSVWLDDLSRNLLRSGKLQQLIDTRSVVGRDQQPVDL